MKNRGLDMNTDSAGWREVAEHRIGNPVKLESDGTFGIPVKMKAYLSAREAARIVMYVTGTNMSRVGRDDDITIVNSLLQRDCLVIETDYGNHPLAVCPGLDWSLQALRTKIIRGEFFHEQAFAGRISDYAYTQIFILPAGYNVEFDHVFWEIDRHGTDGTLEQIASVWNTDLKGVHGEKKVVWNRNKAVTNDFDFEDANCFLGWIDKTQGTFRTKIKYTVVRDIFDCVKPDGTPLDMKLYMHLIYPSDPAGKVPVMCLASSAESLVGSWTSPTRPHLTGFLLRGYAGVIFDYGYTPMARTDHYDYFDGWPMPGAVTGDNCTYSINVYNERLADAAAIRTVRYLAKTDKRFRFDTEALGVYGNSKSGHVTILGEKHPERYAESRMFAGHHGETRFENGKTQDEKWIHGGEVQPCLTYPDGNPISSGVNFTIATSGGGNLPFTAGHAPLYAVCTMGEPDCGRGNYAPNVNACRINDVPCLYLAAPGLGHDLAHGKDRRYGIETYDALFSFADYWMKHGRASCVYSEPRNGDTQVDTKCKMTLHFTGAISEDEIRKVLVETEDGEITTGTFTPSYGCTEWTYMPDMLRGGTRYRIIVPADIKTQNGQHLEQGFEASFETRELKHIRIADAVLKEMDTEDGPTFLIKDYKVGIRDRYMLRLRVTNDAVNIVRLMAVSTRGAFHSVRGRYTEMRRIRICGAGVYETDITDLLRSQENFEPMSVRLQTVYEAGEKQRTLTPGQCEIMPGEAAVQQILDCDGEPVLRTNYFNNNEGAFSGEAFVTSPGNVATYSNLFKIGMLTEEDEGRRFRVEIDYRDTTSRALRINVEPIGVRGIYGLLDFDANRYWLKTQPDVWSTFRFETSIREPLCWDARMQKNMLNISIEPTGDRTILPGYDRCLNPLCPFDIGQVRVYEIHTGIVLDETNPLWLTKETVPD